MRSSKKIAGVGKAAVSACKVNRLKSLLAIFLSLLLLPGLCGCEGFQEAAREFEDSFLPAYSNAADIDLGDGTWVLDPAGYYRSTLPPDFSDSSRFVAGYESYSVRDRLGRCGPCEAYIGTETMPEGKRSSISEVHPTGWENVYYDFIGPKGDYLYNRCHLVAFSLSGENKNERNLITGTLQMNAQMTSFEGAVRDYVNKGGNHVMYRVTPDFHGDELVARGVKIEALSVEDGGQSVCLNVYLENRQDGVEIDYATGESAAGNSDASGSCISPDAADAAYVLNRKSKRFHRPMCDSVSAMNPNNRVETALSRDELIAQGYMPCGACNP